MNPLYWLIGNFSFLLLVSSFLMTNMLKLRLVAIVSGIASVIYNATLPTGPLWLVVFWMSVLTLINVIMLARDLHARRPLRLSEAEDHVREQAFPGLPARDWKRLMKKGTLRVHQKGEVLQRQGLPSQALHILISGQLQETRGNQKWQRSPGFTWGVLTFLTRQNDLPSPCTFVVASPSAQVFTLPYPDLKRLLARQPHLSEPLLEGMVRGVALHSGLLATPVTTR